MRFLLDTNVISETRRRQADPNVIRWFERTDPNDVYLSVLALGEIAKGVAKIRQRDPAAARALDDWMAGLRSQFADRLVPVDAAVAEAWGRLAGIRSLPVIDGLLAATAMVHGMALVTRNGRDVADSGAEILNPWDDLPP